MLRRFSPSTFSVSSGRQEVRAARGGRPWHCLLLDPLKAGPLVSAASSQHHARPEHFPRFKAPLGRKGSAMVGRKTNVVICLLGASLVLGGCEPRGGEFLCGIRTEGSADNIRRCDRVHEVCICASNSCAQRVPTTECTSGLQYVRDAFAQDGLRGQCVDPIDQNWLIEEDATVLQCTTKRPVPESTDGGQTP